jgi:hypothetical protein
METKIAFRTIKELTEIMCKEMGVTLDQYNDMDLSGQYKIRQAYTKKTMNLNPRKAK